MTYLIDLIASLLLVWFCASNEITVSDNTMLILAILTAGEVISWKLKR